MSGALAPPADAVPDGLARRPAPAPIDGEAQTDSLVRRVLARRAQFGITRVGCVTRLDRIGLPVVQVARPLALSNAVSQGKGLTLAAAAASALMESLETWAAERIPQVRTSTSSVAELGPTIRALYAGSLAPNAPRDWADLPLTWIEGWDLLGETCLPVPLAVVDTVYTVPSPHPAVFPRTTTGLGAGASLEQAVVHAGLEVLERDAVARAQRTPHFFDHRRIDLASVIAPTVLSIVQRIVGAGFKVGAWQVPAAHACPVYWVHVMEDEGHAELAPLPGEGFGCDLTRDRALTKALLEAAQARLAALSGAREDITRRSYPSSHDRAHLAAWRRELDRGAGGLSFTAAPEQADPRPRGRLAAVLAALATAGARAATIVPLFVDEGLHVVRLSAPPLAQGAHI